VELFKSAWDAKPADVLERKKDNASHTN
jgi:hypothetical protein